MVKNLQASLPTDVALSSALWPPAAMPHDWSIRQKRR